MLLTSPMSGILDFKRLILVLKQIPKNMITEFLQNYFLGGTVPFLFHTQMRLGIIGKRLNFLHPCLCPPHTKKNPRKSNSFSFFDPHFWVALMFSCAVVSLALCIGSFMEYLCLHRAAGLVYLLGCRYRHGKRE